jgi:hypothetical protein
MWRQIKMRLGGIYICGWRLLAYDMTPSFGAELPSLGLSGNVVHPGSVYRGMLHTLKDKEKTISLKY